MAAEALVLSPVATEGLLQAADPSRYRAAIVTSFAAVERDWAELESRNERPAAFQSVNWCGAWLRAAALAGNPQAVHIVTVRAQGRLVLLWPLAVRQAGRCKVLHALAEPATQYCEALVDPLEDRAAVLAEAWRAIASTDADLLDLRRVRQDAELRGLPGLGMRRVLTTSRSTAPFLDCAPSASGAPSRQRGSKTRNALKRHLRNLAQHGPLAFETVTDTAEKAHTLAEAYRLKQKWLMSRGLWSHGYSHAAAIRFAETVAALEELLVLRLTVGSELAAVESGFAARGCFWSLMQSYEPRLASHSPGRLLTWHLIENAAALNINRIDFLAPTAPHKLEWASGEVAVCDHLIPLTLRGLFACQTLLAARGPLKRLYALLPAGARRRAARFAGRS